MSQWYVVKVSASVWVSFAKRRKFDYNGEINAFKASQIIQIEQLRVEQNQKVMQEK